MHVPLARQSHGAFPSDPFTLQVNSAVNSCPLIREGFLGLSCTPVVAKEPLVTRDRDDGDVSGDGVAVITMPNGGVVDASDLAFVHIKVGSPLKQVLSTTKPHHSHAFCLGQGFPAYKKVRLILQIIR
jgi:hypothetical protein